MEERYLILYIFPKIDIEIRLCATDSLVKANFILRSLKKVRSQDINYFKIVKIADDYDETLDSYDDVSDCKSMWDFIDKTNK